MIKKALKLDNPTNAFINKNFIIRVKVSGDKKQKLTSANKLSNYIKDDQIKIKLFDKLIAKGLDKHTFLIRNRLKIHFCSK